MGKGRKAKKDEDDWENDLQDIAKESGITLGGDTSEDFEITVTKKKEKKKKKKAANDDEGDNDVEEDFSNKALKGKPSFNALLLDDNSDVDDDTSDKMQEDDQEITAKSKLNQENKGNHEDRVEEETEKSGGNKGDAPEKRKGKGKKKDKGKQKEDEDIDALLADLELSEKKEPESKKGKKKGKKKADNDEAVSEKEKIDVDMDDGDTVAPHSESTGDVPSEPQTANQKEETQELDDEGPKMKTAAQKKAEKKEREKQKKEAQKAAKKEKEKKDVVQQSTDASAEPTKEESVANKETVSPAAEGDEIVDVAKEDKGESGDSDGEGETKDKKKKKKKKKKGEEEKPKKKIGKAAVKKMQELIEKQKEEEERLRQEEEAKLKALEEAENRRLEKLRLEQERKEKKKQKEKERKERLKKEGKLLTPQQKEAKRRAELMLLAMKEQGIEVPSKETVTEKKKVQYVSKRQKQKQNITQSPDTTERTKEEQGEVAPAVTSVEGEKVEESDKDKDGDDLPDSWDQEEEDNGVKDSWDAESEPEDSTGDAEIAVKEDNKELAAVPVVPTQPEVKDEVKQPSEESEESEGESSSEDEESEESEDEESESSSEDEKLTADKIKERARERIRKRREQAEENRSTDKLRCPVICVLGHVDTGKTKILDKIRHTHVQDGEAGGITQQIGATMVPVEAIREQSKMVKEFVKFDLRLPGLLIIDTPGHESFSNLRSRGSSLCDMAILVVDIMHGLEQQTLESINLLRKKQTPFVVALNKIDRLFEWKRGPASQIEDTIKKQKRNTKQEFEERLQQIIGEFAEQGLNAAPFYKNLDEKVYISLVPTSAHSGDGMGDLIALICKLTQNRLAKKLAFSEEIQSTVMEVKALPGLGTTVDVILVNGRLREGDTIVTGGLEGPIVTQVRAVLTPQPLRELRVKSQYIQHKEIEGAQGVKITGKDLEKVMAGAPLFVADKDDEIEVYKDEVNDIVSDTLQAIKVSDRGVYVQASTLGSLEALLEFLKTSKIPYSGVNIGPVHKKDVMRSSVMLEHEKMFAVILAFDVKVEREAQEFADKEGVKIFTADIIYHLFDKFTAYTEEYKQKKREEFKNIAIFPTKLRVMPQHIFNTRDPIVIGVHVEGGTVRLGTPLAVPSKEFVEIGFVTGIEANHKQMEKATAGQEVCIKIEPVSGEAPKMYGRHFTHEDLLMSKINRESIDALKNYFREEMQKSDWQLIIEMKKIFGII